ncbi:hypothetical protein FACS189419_04050 [Planctomycetales bacterium]|nr:hypothetical protein FACS189419_04050 [Planctomycetales bacterium]
MNTTFTLKAALLTLVTLFTVNTYAEVLVGQRDTLPGFAFQLMTQAQAGSNSASWTDGIQVYDKETEQAFRLFCTDLFTSTSTEFGNGEGQLYHPASLTESQFHSDTQKSQLQSLFDHVYTKAFNADYSYRNDLFATIFQLAVWEIANDTADHLSLRDGYVYITKALVIDQGLNGEYNRNHWDTTGTILNEALDTLDTWFDAILNNSWEAIGYDEDKVNLTVYLADGGTDRSQTFIGVAPTPEPATMLLFGLGLAGLGLVRRKR